MKSNLLQTLIAWRAGKVSAAGFALAITVTAATAGPAANILWSTAGGYPTWDSDLVNIEKVTQTGKGVYVAVLDTGLVPNWKDYFPAGRVATHLGKGFHQPVTFKAHSKGACFYEIEVGQMRESTWVGSIGSSHGTHVASTIIGYWYRSNFDALEGFPLPPIVIRGVAPDVTIIPVRVLSDYQVPAIPKCGIPSQNAVFGTSEMIAAGINYATDLAIAGYRPMVINMSLGGGALEAVEQAAIDRAIANGVIVVAAAGNAGEAGMGYPGAYPPVISVGSVGWAKEWFNPSNPDATPTTPPPSPRYRLWWLQSVFYPFIDIPEPTPPSDVYLSDFSSRAVLLWGQELDVLAPGSWVRGPFAGDPGYSHLPWWSRGIGDLLGRNPGNFYYVGGTSMATPHVASVAALMLQKNSSLTQAQVESVLKTSALTIPDTGAKDVYDIASWVIVTWDTDCNGTACDPVGAGLIQADAAIAATP